MAKPNLIAPATIEANNASYLYTGIALDTLANSNWTQIISNSAASGKSYRVHSIYASNTDGVSVSKISLILFNGATASGYIAYKVDIPANSTVVLVNKDAPLWLLENQTLRAARNNEVDIVCSWEEIS